MEYHIPLAESRDRSALLLAIDDYSLPLKKNLCLYLTKPAVRSEPVLRASRDDEQAVDNLAAHFYGTVLYDKGRYRMWYYACHWGRNPDWPPELARHIAKETLPLFMGPLCYAESDDGIHWVKPKLGQVLFKGSRDNNALALPHGAVSAATLIRDDDDPDPARRYKMVYEFFTHTSDPPLEEYTMAPTVACAVSADGLHWTVTQTPYPREFVEQSSFYKHDGKYIINSQNSWGQIPGVDATPRGRQGFARFSPDFECWIEGQVESFASPEPLDPAHRGPDKKYDQVHLGVGAASFGSVCVGLYGLWHNQAPDEPFDVISADLGLVVSNDGLHFREPVKGHVYIDRADSPATPAPGKSYNTILCQANGILNVGAETRIYHGRWLNAWSTGADLHNYDGEIALATLPRDRWGGLGLFPDEAEGSVWTAPFTVPDGGCTVTLNVDGAHQTTVEVADDRFNLHSQIGAASPAAISVGGGFDCPVSWPGASLAPLAGQKVRLKITLRRDGAGEPRLYAANLRA
jgi:hypothetical protein